MSARLHNEYLRWIQAEEAEDAAEAEAALSALFAEVPRLAPRPGFTERVLWAVSPTPAKARARWFGFAPDLWGKAATVAALTLAALSAGLLPLVRLLPLEPPTMGSIVGASARATAWLAGWLDLGFDVWALLAQIGGAFGTAAGTPQGASALLASALLAGFAMFGLNHLLAIERSPSR